MDEKEFANFLREALMYENGPILLDEPFPQEVFDSTGVLMLSTAIEDKFGILIPMEEVAKYKNPREIYEYIARQL